MNNSVSHTPAAEIDIDIPLVRSLLLSQHPDLAHLEIVPMAPGWDNAMFRLSEQLSVRLPRRALAAPLIECEQRWLPQIAAHVPLPIPAPIRVGKPGVTYPWSWSILPWLDGTAADEDPPNADQSVALASFLKALHRPAPDNSPRNPYRGVPLTTRAVAVEERLVRLATTQAITPRIQTLWKQSLVAPIDVNQSWLHGDLHARNVLVHQGRLSAIIDWGDICQGDCATDLAAIWMLLPTRESRAAAIQAYGASPQTWQRALGWAIVFGTILLDTGLVDNPRHASMGELTLRRVHEGPWPEPP